MGKYVKCPRCELNWITPDMEYCEVCQAELAGALILEDEEEILCPRCKQNYLEPGETICASCKAAKAEVGEEEDTYVEKVATPDAEEGTVSLAEMEEKEWAEDVEEPYDDDDAFGNESDFVDTPEDEDILDEEEEEEEPVTAENEEVDDFVYPDEDFDPTLDYDEDEDEEENEDDEDEDEEENEDDDEDEEDDDDEDDDTPRKK